MRSTLTIVREHPVSLLDVKVFKETIGKDRELAPCVIMERITRRIVSRTDLCEYVGKLVGNVHVARARTSTIIAVYIRISRSEILDASLPGRFSDSRI